MKRLRIFMALAFGVLLGGAALVPAASVSAYDPLADVCASSDNAVCDHKDEDATDLIGTVVNTMLFIVGALAVVMIIFGGILYVTSTGDSGRVSKAKNTLTYSIVGLVVAFLAYAIVNWVFDLF